MDQLPPAPHAAAPPRWQAISAKERRVVGVLVEKAKTTPEAYPLSLNAVRTAANQKSNRFPTMEMEADEVQTALDRLRTIGAVSVVQGGSRVERYRHLLYEWLGVDKVELAVMAELLLRGAQTEGELRGRAARMEPIADVAALRPILERLKEKRLVVSLTREGRGHVLTHNLYKPEELERLRAQYASYNPDAGSIGSDEEQADAPPRTAAVSPAAAPPSAQRSPSSTPVEASYQRELSSLRDKVADLEATVADLSGSVDSCREEIRQLREALGA